MGTADTQWGISETKGCRRTGHGAPRSHRTGTVRERIQDVTLEHSSSARGFSSHAGAEVYLGDWPLSFKDATVARYCEVYLIHRKLIILAEYGNNIIQEVRLLDDDFGTKI